MKGNTQEKPQQHAIMHVVKPRCYFSIYLCNYSINVYVFDKTIHFNMNRTIHRYLND